MHTSADTAGWEFWIDRGGTFTDVIGAGPQGELVVRKVPSVTRGEERDPGLTAALSILRDAGVAPDSIRALKVGTTVVTNALLERRGSRVLWVTTRGFADALVIGNQSRPDIFDCQIRRPMPLHAEVLELDERVSATGEVLQAPDAFDTQTSLRAARERGCDAVAIVLMHGWRHTAHERIVAQWADSALFTAAMAYNFQPAGVAQVFAGAPAENVQAFVADRAAMRGGAARMSSTDAATTYKSYLRRIASMLHGQDFLLGSQPCVADFAVYHPIWFTQNITSAVAGVLDATPEVLAWLERMKAIGHGQSEKMSSAQALEMAQEATPAALTADVFQDDHGIALGSTVVIAADNFGLEPTEGELIAATRTRYTLRRTDERAGTVHVHFPRVGFTLKKAAA